jgi:hypothetical protein
MLKSGRKTILIAACFGFALVLSACGGGGAGDTLGGGGCGGGAAVAGVVLCVDSIEPIYLGSPTPSVDIFQGSFANGQCANAGEVEIFTDHGGRVTLSAQLAQGATQPPASRNVTITHYTIEYTANSGVIGPTVRPTGNLFETMTITVGPTGFPGSVQRDLALMTTTQKTTFLLDLGLNGGFDGIARPYTVTYTFYGQDQFGNQLVARGFTQVVIGSYLNACA